MRKRFQLFIWCLLFFISTAAQAPQGEKKELDDEQWDLALSGFSLLAYLQGIDMTAEQWLDFKGSYCQSSQLREMQAEEACILYVEGLTLPPKTSPS